MKKAKLRKILHAMIDSLDNKYILYDLNKNIFPYVIRYRTKKMDKADDNLTDEQAIQLDETIRNPAKGETFTLKEVEKSFAKWLPDEVKQKKKEKKISKIPRKKLKRKLHDHIDGIGSKYLLNVLLDDIMPDAFNTSKYD